MWNSRTASRMKPHSLRVAKRSETEESEKLRPNCFLCYPDNKWKINQCINVIIFLTIIKNSIQLIKDWQVNKYLAHTSKSEHKHVLNL